MKNNLLYILLLGCLYPGNLAVGQDNSLLYKISGKDLDAPSYAFGTIHLICPEDLYFSEELKMALKESQQLVLELDFDDPNMISAVQAGVMMKDGQTLEKLYTEKEFAAINDFTTSSFGQPASSFNTMKPFFLMSMLYPQYLGCQTASMELELVNLANQHDMEILGMETAEEQLKALDKIGMDTQAKMLLESIEEFDEQKSVMLELLSLYKAGDIEALYAYSSEESSEYENFDEVMLVGRNVKWIERMEKLMAEMPTFFAVGAAHLGGENGVLNLLQKEGFTVTPVIMEKQEDARSEGITSGKMGKLLIGIWRVDDSQIEVVAEEAIDNAVKQNPEVADQISEQKEGIVQMVKDSRKEYHPDGTFKLVVPDASTQTGTWSIDEETATITETDSFGNESVKKITELTESTMITVKEGETPRILKRAE